VVTFKLSFRVSQLSAEEMTWEFAILTCIRMYSYKMQDCIGYMKMVFSGYAWITI